MKAYDKLVRDKIIQIIEAKGEKATFHIAEEGEYKEKLFEKLKEETLELIQDESIGEVADVLEVLDAIMEMKGWTWEEAKAVQKKKREERGGLSKRIILEES